MSLNSSISPFVANQFDLSEDQNLDDGLQEICYCCKEKKRQMEEANESNDLTSMMFDGEFSEPISGYVDILALAH